VLPSSGENAALPPSLFGYDVISKLGQGAASKIYVVSDPTGQIYALKHVVRETDKHDRYIEQLTNEFEIGRRFQHQALRRIIDLKLKRPIKMGRPTEAALIMELIDGTPLDERPPSSLRSIFAIFKQVGEALSVIHHQHFVHCDVKPHNIMRCADDTIKMIDFGQTCAVGTEKPRVQGTPDYIAPEQVKCKPVDSRTDLYNYGATLYWALTGRRVPTYITVEKSQRHIVKKQEFPTPHDLNPGVPTSLSDLAMKCLRYYPEDRPVNIATVLHTLDMSETEVTMNRGQPQTA
jgi:serine/threonine protein kinase